MENKKNLVINCAVCDTRYVQESVLAAYDKIEINSSTILTSPRSRELLSQYSVALNAADIVDADFDVKVSSINGKAEIKPGQACPDSKTLLIVNGTLDIAPGSEELLKNYVGIHVCGSITCPESIVSLLTMVKVNGSIQSYPDGCIHLKNTAILDRTFHMQAKQDARYYASRRVVALAPDINFAAMTEKNVEFVTEELLVAESLAEIAIPLFNEQAKITILPDGCAFINDSATLDEFIIHRYGGKLYINGDFTVNKSSAPWLEQVSYLRINGALNVTKDMKNAIYDIDMTCKEIHIIAGTWLTDRTKITVDRAMLEQAVDGLSLSDCTKVEFDKDVPPELIRERLISITDCTKVVCSKEQRNAIELVATDVIKITDNETDPDARKTTDNEAPKTTDNENVINTSIHTL